MNRNVLQNNIKIISPSIAIFVHNFYSALSRLFVLGGTDLKFYKGKREEDAIAMAIYAISIIPILFMIMEVVNETKAAVSWLIVKETTLHKAKGIVSGSNLNITIHGYD